jgi:hypothetical protein
MPTALSALYVVPDLAQREVLQGVPRLRGRIVRLFTASEGSYCYSHHASLGVHGGMLYAFWSNGLLGEDEPSQVQCWSVRDAQGVWSTPRVLARAPTNPAVHPEMTTVINGGTAVSARYLTSFYSEYKGRPSDGAGGEGKWSLPLSTGVQVLNAHSGAWTHRGIVLEDMLLNEGPRRTARGRWIMTGEDHRGRTRVAYSDAEDPADRAWRMVGVPKGEGPVFKNEASWYQRPDGKLALVLRDDGRSGRIWVSLSADQGVTWEEPQPTNLCDAVSKCYVGQLSDGAYYIISNPNPERRRIPLTIALSDDGVRFDRVAILRDEDTAPRLPGRYKGSGYQYPNAVQHAGKLHIIYSVNKEEIEVQSIPLVEMAGLC